MAVPLELKFAGCLIGSALGDAIGELAFRFRSKTGLDSAVQSSPVLRYTDDTAMAIGVAQSLIRRGTVDPEDLGRTFHENFKSEPWRGYASGPPAVFSRVESAGVRYTEAAAALFGGLGSFGNGSAMRVAPVGLFFRDRGELYARAAESALPTHSHELARDGAAVQAKAVAVAVSLQPEGPFSCDMFLGELERFAGTREFRDKMALARELAASGAPDAQAARALGKSVAIHESLPFAIYCFAKYPHSFEECIYCAILNGGDRDTLGAMAGAVCGARLGAERIPEKWRQKLEGRALFEDLAVSLAKASL